MEKKTIREHDFYKLEQFYTDLNVLENLGDIKDYQGGVMEVADKFGWPRAIYHEIFNLKDYYKFPNQDKRIYDGDVVVDLGSGAGNDCFIARHETGETGKVIGVDFTPAMIDKARSNAEVRGFNNVEFRQGDIESMPITANTADVIVSNCVLNLVPNKDAVIKDIYRVLKPGGHFSISDVVLVGALPEGLRKDAEMYAGCVSGAIQKEVYMELIHANGFENVTIQNEKPIIIPDDILINYLTTDQIAAFKNGATGIFSVTVFAKKPMAEKCVPGGGCC